MKLIESILSSENVIKAQSRVISNKGCAGIDGMHVDALVEYMRTNWMGIKESILARKYKPAPVRRVEIPKPNGGVRKLGIPTVLDRTIQQAIVQVLSPIFENEFQEHSYGFRPCRSCEQAVLKFLDYLNEGYEWIVDIDLEKFFDKVPQDKLMSYVGRVICDPDTESLICKYLKSGVMENGIYEATDEGTPQGANLSPLLSNVMLNELDKELVSRGLRYVRYADDCIIAVGSEASAKRVMRSVTTWIERELGLKVNASKSHICRPTKLKNLGFGFYRNPQTKEWQSRPHESSVSKLVRSLKKLCRVLPPALMAAMPVGANTTCFFFTLAHTYFRKVDLPVPALPVRKTDWRVNWMRFSASWNSGLRVSICMVFCSLFLSFRGT